jgi:hypothetical protein
MSNSRRFGRVAELHSGLPLPVVTISWHARNLAHPMG